MSNSTHCYIYRSKKKDQLFLFVEKKDDFSKVPEPLMEGFGTPEFSFEMDLGGDTRMVRSNPADVLKHLKEQGYFVQMPPPDPLIGERVVQDVPDLNRWKSADDF